MNDYFSHIILRTSIHKRIDCHGTASKNLYIYGFSNSDLKINTPSKRSFLEIVYTIVLTIKNQHFIPQNYFNSVKMKLSFNTNTLKQYLDLSLCVYHIVLSHKKSKQLLFKGIFKFINLKR